MLFGRVPFLPTSLLEQVAKHSRAGGAFSPTILLCQPGGEVNHRCLDGTVNRELDKLLQDFVRQRVNEPYLASEASDG
jgi:hypothetical protein